VARGLVLTALLVLEAIAAPPAAEAGPVLDKVRSQGLVRCGAVPRPGLLDRAADGRQTGMLLDLCRAIAAAVLGPQSRILFTAYDAETSFEAVRKGEDDVFFLSGSEILGEKLEAQLLPGPAVFYETTAVMVPDGSGVRKLEDLAQHAICFEQGSNAHRHLEAWFEAHRLDFQRMGYQETEEMRDAYNAQLCQGLAGEATALAEAALDGGVKGLHSRILAEPLAAFPILASTGIKDGQWSAVVAWTVATLIRADAPRLNWAAGGLDSIRIEGRGLGLDDDWQRSVVAVAGSYGEIFGRNLGAASRYRLPRGLNASWQEGGLLLPPYLE
jgi:general L-amino acid transport system substrate-binding protein